VSFDPAGMRLQARTSGSDSFRRKKMTKNKSFVKKDLQESFCCLIEILGDEVASSRTRTALNPQYLSGGRSPTGLRSTVTHDCDIHGILRFPKNYAFYLVPHVPSKVFKV
jgi:hypothetical protein